MRKPKTLGEALRAAGAAAEKDGQIIEIRGSVIHRDRDSDYEADGKKGIDLLFTQQRYSRGPVQRLPLTQYSLLV